VPQCFGSSSCTHEETRFATRRENLRKKNKTIVHYKKVFLFSVGFSKSKNRLRRKNLKNRLRRRGPKKREKKTGGVWPVFFIKKKTENT